MPCLVSLTGKDSDFQSLSWATWATEEQEEQNDCCFSSSPVSTLCSLTCPLAQPNMSAKWRTPHRSSARPSRTTASLKRSGKVEWAWCTKPMIFIQTRIPLLGTVSHSLRSRRRCERCWGGSVPMLTSPLARTSDGESHPQAFPTARA
jgi:hypothetical protein